MKIFYILEYQNSLKHATIKKRMGIFVATAESNLIVETVSRYILIPWFSKFKIHNQVENLLSETSFDYVGPFVNTRICLLRLQI